MDDQNNYYSLLSASPISWENFFEVLAQLTSFALTDRETEAIIASFHAFHARLKRLSNRNLRRLAEEASTSEYRRPHCRHDGKTCVQNALRGYIKAFAVGYGVKFLVEAIPALLTGRLFKRPDILRQMGGRDTIEFGMFLSAFIGTYKAILCGLRNIRKQHGDSESGDQLNALIAGTVAGLSLCLERNRGRRQAIALYLSTRSAQFACVWLMNRWSAYRARKRRGLMRVRSEIVLSKVGSSPATAASSAVLGGEHRGGASGKARHKTSGYTIPDEATHHGKSGQMGGAGSVDSQIVEDIPKPSVRFDKSAESGSSSSSSSAHNVVTASNIKDGKITHPIDDEPADLADKVDAWLRRWGGTIVMALSSSQILCAYIVAPQTLPRSYYGFLVTHGGLKAHYGTLAVPLLNQMGETVLRMNTLQGAEVQIPDNMTSIEYVAREISPNLATIYTPHARHRFAICALEHPWDTSCTQAHISTFIGAMGRSLKLYLPLNVVMTLIYSGKKLMKDPVKTLLRFVKSTLRSSLFLSSYVTMAWIVPCVLRYTFKRERIWFYYLNGILSGLCAIIDAPGRRIELGMYCLPRALESFWKCGVQWGWWRNIKNAELVYFSFAMGILMSIYQTAPESIQGGYRDVMTRCFGKN